VYHELYDAHRVVADREERRSAFAGIRAIVIVDGAPADGADRIRTELADSVVVLATRATVTWGGPATDVQLDGLAGADAVALLARRVPDVGEQPSAARLIALLRGNPRRLVQAAALGTRLRLPLAGLIAALEAGPEEELRRLLVESLEPADRSLVELLAGACGATLAIERLQALTGIPDVAARMQTLERDGIVQSGSPRYRAVGVAAGLERADHAHVAIGLLDSPTIDDLPAAMELLRVLDDKLVIGLGRAYAPVALYGRRWEAWNEILERVYAASQKTRDTAATAWALHHLGTAAYVRGNPAAAEAALKDALGIRQGIGDERGAAATRHNLDFIAAPPGPPPNGDTPITPKPPGPRGWLIAAVATVSALAIAAGVAIAGRDGDEEPDPPTPTPTATQTAPPTQTPTETATTAPAEITVTITAPEDDATYAPEDVPVLAFSCTGEPEECSATVQSSRRGSQPAKVDPGSSLPAERGFRYTVTAVAVNEGAEVARDSATYVVPFEDDIPPTPEATLTPTPSAPPGP
jgi:hypothetical protein